MAIDDSYKARWNCYLGKRLKATASTIVPSLTTLFNLSMKIPMKWKISSVVRIPKTRTLVTIDRYPFCLWLAGCWRNIFMVLSLKTWLIETCSPKTNGVLLQENSQ